MTETRAYHHGELADALVRAGLDAVREPGSAALSLREVTRSVGVTPAAAYRHFRNRADLVAAVSYEIQLRMAERMRRGMSAPRGESAQERAIQRLRGVGRGYVEFALAEPGWFSTAFFGDGSAPVDPEPEGGRVAPPFALLVSALDGLSEAGLLSPERRRGAEFSCWSAVHGCAELMVHGPLRGADAAFTHEVSARVVEDAITGVLGGVTQPRQ